MILIKKMLRAILLVAFLGVTFGFQQVSQVVIQHVTHEDTRSTSARFKNWIRIPIEVDNPTIKRIIWCRSLFHHTVERDVDPTNLLRSTPFVSSETQVGCNSPGLVLMQLYPGSYVSVHQPEEEPRIVYIDPSGFDGMWDDQHDMEVVIEMRINQTTMANHIAKFDAVKKDVEVETTTAEVTTASPLSPKKTHPWGAVLGIFFGGAAVFGLMAYGMYRRKMGAFAARKKGHAMDDLIDSNSVEMSDLDSDEAIRLRMNNEVQED